jgi:hypothetical protein
MMKEVVLALKSFLVEEEPRSFMAKEGATSMIKVVEESC